MTEPPLPDLELEDILKQFLKDFGEDGPINPLGVAINKIDHLIYQRLIEARKDELNMAFLRLMKRPYLLSATSLNDYHTRREAGLNKLVGDQK